MKPQRSKPIALEHGHGTRSELHSFAIFIRAALPEADPARRWIDQDRPAVVRRVDADCAASHERLSGFSPQDTGAREWGPKG